MFQPARRTARGFTLVELLVVIAIIGVLVALLLPAVQAARESARRMSCGNNLKQLGLALHNHHDAKNTFPPGGMNTGANGTVCFTTWSIEILPFMEQQTLYEKYRQDLHNEDPVNTPVVQTRLKAHECPSDNLAGKLEEPASGQADVRNIQYRHGSYRAVSGKGQLASGHGAWDTNEPNLWPGGKMDHAYKGVLHATGSAYNGVPAPTGNVLEMGGPERFSNITDGTSNTLMVGELTFTDVTRRATFWAYTYASYNQSSICSESRTLNNRFGQQNVPGSGCWGTPGLHGDQMCKRAFGSNHPNGLNFVLADGSMRFVSYNVDINMLQNAATIGAGESGNLP